MHRVVGNRYTFVRALGSGGVGEVFLARDEVLGREVAVKVLSRRCACDGEFVERFRREARSAGSLSHPNVVAVHDFGQDPADGAPYIVMEYVPGGTLADVLKEEGALSPGRAASIALGIARGLGEAHRHGVVHRDVKPANVLLADPSGETRTAPSTGPAIVKVTDFGIARRLVEDALTEENAVMGTAHYLSPEQATGDPVGPASDLYSLGVVLYEMLTGRRPFEASQAESPLALAMKHVTETPRSPREANPEVPEDLEYATLWLLSKDPEERPESAAALAEELEKMAGYVRARSDPGRPEVRGEVEEAKTLRIPVPAEAERREGYAGAIRRGPRRRLAVTVATLPVLVLLAILAVVSLDERPAEGDARPVASARSEQTDGRQSAPEAATGGTREAVPSGDENDGGGASQGRGEASKETAEPSRQVRGIADGGPEESADAVADPEAAARQAAVDYYEAVDRESWAYTYANLGSQSRQMFTEREWYQKNQWIADNEGLDLASMEVNVTGISPSGTHAEVDVRRTFGNGVVIDRDTIFVFEGGSWKHRLVGNELIFFMPSATYEEFVAAQ